MHDSHIMPGIHPQSPRYKHGSNQTENATMRNGAIARQTRIEPTDIRSRYSNLWHAVKFPVNGMPAIVKFIIEIARVEIFDQEYSNFAKFTEFKKL